MTRRYEPSAVCFSTSLVNEFFTSRGVQPRPEGFIIGGYQRYRVIPNSFIEQFLQPCVQAGILVIKTEEETLDVLRHMGLA